MRKFKKMTAIMLAAVMMCGLFGCGSKQDSGIKEATEETIDTTAAELPDSTEEEGDIVEEDTTPYGQGNMIHNGDFSNGVGNFCKYTNGGQAEMDVNADGELQIDIDKIGTVEHGVQVYYDGFAIRQGGVYEVSFDIHGTAERDVDWRVQVNGGDYHAYVMDTVKLTNDVQHISAQFTMDEETDPAPRFCFNMGQVNSMKEAGIDSVEPHSIMIDNVSLIVVDATNMIKDPDPVYVPKAKVNQLGYHPKDQKIAVFCDLDKDDTTFKVVDAKSNETVFEGDLTERDLNVVANEWNNLADFSAFDKPGTYKLVSGKGEESFEFTIADDVYRDTFDSVVKMLYLQRCGMELTSDCAGDFAHPVCHAEQATIYGTSNKIDVSGGWHDAGDYGRYVVPGAKAVADILLSYEKNPKAFTDDTGIPESGNGVSDALDEARYELEWMMKMQDSAGGVYHKVTCAVFPETVMPQDETDELIVCPISIAATADFAAVMAMASRVYQDSDKAFADKCLEVSKKAWTYAKENPDGKGFKNPEDIVTGEYPNGQSDDEFFWASAELYKTTGDDAYKQGMSDAVEKLSAIKGLGWADVGIYGAYAALTSDKLLSDSSNLRKTIQDGFFKLVNETVETSKENEYQVDRAKKYEWGSNMNIANSGILLLMANDIEENADYMKYAKQHRDYLMGVNATGYCFITGSGTLTPEHPHHRPSQVLEKAMPGMLVGGPDNGLDDPYAKAVFLNTAAAKCYADNAQSYSCNEVTIYWNSPLIYLMAALEE